jgi:hypothetical protein
MKRAAPSVLAMCLLGLLGAPAQAALFTMNPTEDAFVSSANPSSNYGGAGALAVAAAGLPKGEFDSVMKFDLAPAKASFDSLMGAGLWTVTSIALQLTATGPNNAMFNGNGAGPGGTNINFAGSFSMSWMQNHAWVEGTGTPAIPTTTGITFATLSSFQSGADQSLGTFAFGGATTGNNVWTLGLASSLVADVTAGNVAGMLMLPADSAVAYLTDSRSFGTATLRPQLTVTASPVPEPGSAALLAGGAFAWLATRRRHARKA